MLLQQIELLLRARCQGSEQEPVGFLLKFSKALSVHELGGCQGSGARLGRVPRLRGGEGNPVKN